MIRTTLPCLTWFQLLARITETIQAHLRRKVGLSASEGTLGYRQRANAMAIQEGRIR